MKRLWHLFLLAEVVCVVLASCVTSQGTPLERDLRRVRPGMTAEQVEPILGRYRTGPVGSGVEAKEDSGNPMGGIPPGVITYPLWDTPANGPVNGERYYRALTGHGDWEYGIVEFRDGRVVAVRSLR